MAASKTNVLKLQIRGGQETLPWTGEHYHDRQRGRVLVRRPSEGHGTSAADPFFHVVLNFETSEKLPTQMSGTC